MRPAWDAKMCMRREAFWKLAANLLRASRFFLAALRLTAYASSNRHPPRCWGPMALAGAASDFADGRLARQTGSPRRVRTMARRHCRYRFRSHGSLGEARAGSIPAYIPILIALSFAQYALDSVVILGSATPVASRLGPLGRHNQLCSGDRARVCAAANFEFCPSADYLIARKVNLSPHGLCVKCTGTCASGVIEAVGGHLLHQARETKICIVD